MVEDLAARAFAEGESGLRVSARIVKELFESEATMVSTNFFCLAYLLHQGRGGPRAGYGWAYINARLCCEGCGPQL